MPLPLAHTPGFGAFLGAISWWEPLAALVGVAGLGVLAWQLACARRNYVLDLAEQARLVAEAQDQTRGAVQEKEAAARESKAKSEMLATLSREIRAHLNGIIGSADLMLDHTLSPPQREHLARLRTSAESLHQSLNDVLDYSSIETGQIQIDVAPFDLRQPFIEVTETLLPLARLKGLELVVIVAPDVPVQVSGDVTRMRQILLNLLSNAVKFTARGRVVMRVERTTGSAAASLHGATWLHFSVSDTGAGIPEELQATIFDRTVLPNSTSPRQAGGSGLELVISKRLVELMGGQIGVRNQPEGGTEFWFVLALPAMPGPAPATGPATGRHVVVLDELAASRVALSAMLARLGIDQDATDTVAKAAVLLQEAREAGANQLALLLDESFAKKDAAELTRLLAPESPVRSTRIVVMSRNPEEPAAAGPGFAVTAIVSKPLVRAEVLLAALQAPSGSGLIRTAGSRVTFEIAAAARPAGRPGRPGRHVLIVDDDAISRFVSCQLLEHLGCIVETAVSGTEAVALAGSTAFDLIFMDCQMPEMDGFLATEKIRTAAGGKAPPIVALTANISGPDRAKCFAAGMCDFVAKPAHVADLTQVLQRWAPAEPVP